MKSDDTTIPNILEIKTIGPLSSAKGIKIIFINQKIECGTIFIFYILTFYKFFFTNSVIFNINIFNVIRNNKI